MWNVSPCCQQANLLTLTLWNFGWFCWDPGCQPVCSQQAVFSLNFEFWIFRWFYWQHCGLSAGWSLYQVTLLRAFGGCHPLSSDWSLYLYQTPLSHRAAIRVTLCKAVAYLTSDICGISDIWHLWHIWYLTSVAYLTESWGKTLLSICSKQCGSSHLDGMYSSASLKYRCEILSARNILWFSEIVSDLSETVLGDYQLEFRWFFRCGFRWFSVGIVGGFQVWLKDGWPRPA